MQLCFSCITVTIYRRKTIVTDLTMVITVWLKHDIQHQTTKKFTSLGSYSVKKKGWKRSYVGLKNYRNKNWKRYVTVYHRLIIDDEVQTYSHPFFLQILIAALVSWMNCKVCRIIRISSSIDRNLYLLNCKFVIKTIINVSGMIQLVTDEGSLYRWVKLICSVNLPIIDVN